MRVFTTSFLRPAVLGLLLAMAGTGSARADEALRHIQQSLRDQGFYYGPIDGSPGDETTQAIRRYQIRNGLTVTGQLNDETRRSIDRTGAAAEHPEPAGAADSLRRAGSRAGLSSDAGRPTAIPRRPG